MENTSPYRVLRSALNMSNRSKKTRPVKAAGFQFFNQLPDVLTGVISSSLSTKDAAYLSCSSRRLNVLLHHPPAVPMTVRQFLLHVVRGEHTQMQNMLRANIHLLCQKGIVTDCSGREFGSISGFEYALWALDKYLWDDMLACLPRDNTGHLTEEGQKIVSQLQQQYVHMKTKGVTYRLNGVTKTESHYDFAIINALQENVAAQTAPGKKNWGAIEKNCRTVVGGAQRLFPMHVVDEYCSNTPFYPLPEFNSRPRPAHGLRQFYNWVSPPWESWFRINSKLGFDFVIFKGTGLFLRGRSIGRRGMDTNGPQDLDAMMVLCKTRTLDFDTLETQLELLIAIEKNPHAGF